MTCTIDALATSTGGATARQTTIVTSNTSKMLHIYFKIILGTSPTSNRGLYFWLIKADTQGSPFRFDGAGSSDAALTRVGMPPIKIWPNKTSGAATGDTLTGGFEIYDPGPSWGLAVGHDTGVNLGTGCSLWYIGEQDLYA